MRVSPGLSATLALLLLSACEPVPFRSFPAAGGAPAQTATEPRPRPDGRGIITYPGYQVVVARRAETVVSIATRLGIDPGRLARDNGLSPERQLAGGEVLVLSERVPATEGPVDVAALAGAALERAEAGMPAPPEPERHRVIEGETAYSIARRHDVPVEALSDWNGLGPENEVREGQVLLIPPPRPRPVATPLPPAAPGTGSALPAPPSAADPLPRGQATAAAPALPPSPQLGGGAGGAEMVMPLQGPIIRPFARGRNNGIDISGSAGDPVRAAKAGSVVAITQDTDSVTVMVLRHAGGLLTVYANLGDVQVQKGAEVAQGAQIGTLGPGTPPFLHFEVRNGQEALDPEIYLR